MRQFIATILALQITSCATIEVYQIDRHSIMEEEAAGEWPSFDKKYLKSSQAKGAQFFPKEPDSKRKQRVFTVLKGEFVEAN